MPIDNLPLKIDISVDTQKSSSIEIPSWAKTIVLRVPAITDGTLTLEMIDPDDITAAKLAADQDTDWLTVYSDEGRTDILGIGLDAAWVNISPFLGGFPQGGHMRVVCTVAQIADRDFMAHFKS